MMMTLALIFLFLLWFLFNSINGNYLFLGKKSISSSFKIISENVECLSTKKNEKIQKFTLHMIHTKFFGLNMKCIREDKTDD